MEMPGDVAGEPVNLQEVPPMEIVPNSDSLENLDSDDDSTITGPSEESAPARQTAAVPVKPNAEPIKQSNPPSADTAPSTRRTRGMSFLPVRQSVGVSLQPSSPAGSLSPPTTPSPLRSLTSPQYSDPTKRGGPSKPSKPTTPSAMDTNDSLLGAYMNQLAAKEARVVDLRNTISRLQLDMKQAEAELAEYKENGKRLATLVNSSKAAETATGEGQKDVLGMGRRVVDEIGTQFWSFLEDVKSATMGNHEFQTYRDNPPRSPRAESPRIAASRAPRPPADAIPDQIARPPSPRRQLSPKRSIQEFMKNRPRSPIRRPRSPMNSPELAEQHAKQRLRESERLTRKLSQIDLRAPSPTRAPLDADRDSLL